MSLTKITRIKYTGLFLLLMSCLMACSTLPTQIEPDIKSEPLPIISSVNGWRTVRFQIRWQLDQEPEWYIDTMLAGEIIAPVLASNAAKQLRFWRVHRRAKHDPTGHAFSFIFYTHNKNASDIYNAISGNPSLAQWQREGRIVNIQYDDLTHNQQPNIEDTSDKSWPLEIQKTWPSFMMGSSRMWLDLIAEIKVTNPQKKDSLEHYYQEIQQQITLLWQENGQHAWLHHLNALYGYSPLAIHF